MDGGGGVLRQPMGSSFVTNSSDLNPKSYCGGGTSLWHSLADTSESDFELWRKFETVPPIPGFGKSFIAVSYNQNKTATQVDYSMNEETFACEICRYLIDNGVSNIILTANYNLKNDEDIMKDAELAPELTVLGDSDLYDGDIDVVVVVLRTAEGLLRQRKTYHLVIQMLSVSRVGVIIVGNPFAFKAVREPNWKRFVSYLETEGILQDHLEIVCARHQRVTTNIYSCADLQTQSPLGGCTEFCGVMECGHFCPYQCHAEGHDNERYRCKQPCSRVCELGHQCRQKCWELCGKCCHVIRVDLSCDHRNISEKQLFCFELEAAKCKQPIKKRLSCGHWTVDKCSIRSENEECHQLLTDTLPCGHQFAFRCFEKVPQVKVKCAVPVRREFPCGHHIVLKCYEEKLTKELHCKQLCGKTLNCGHVCEEPCHLVDLEHKDKFQCRKQCERTCQRSVHVCKAKHPCFEVCPPCDSVFDFGLPCRHTVQIRCSDPDPEKSYFCSKPCGLVHFDCRHECVKACGENCGQCEVIVTKEIPTCPRYHQVVLKCHEDPPQLCKYKTPCRNISSCGHAIWLPCHEADKLSSNKLARLCTSNCRNRDFVKEGECGHRCKNGSCAKCYQGRFHCRCTEPCGKVLICGHSCNTPCNMVCPPCRNPCFNHCPHKKCEFECGVPCVWDCQEPCSYACKHSKCTNKCSEVCNKERCNEPCEKILKCGHPCVGFCGEPCPKLCRICDPVDLADGSLLGSGEVGDEDRFILLEDCGHCIESEAMENWLEAQSKGDEILPFRCPICMWRIHWVHRFSNAMHERRKLIDSIRKKIFGCAIEIDSIIAEIESKTCAEMEKYGSPLFTDFLDVLMKRVRQKRYMSPNSELSSMSFEKAKFMEWIHSEWITLNEMLQIHLMDIPEDFFVTLEQCCSDYLFMAYEDRQWPLHPNEMRSLRRERVRLDDFAQLYSYMSPTKNPNNPFENLFTKDLFTEAETCVLKLAPYTEASQEHVDKRLKEIERILNTTLKLSDMERLTIVSAFGQKSGRWFKCKNGHIYVITECGGADELGTCNECGAVIGGERHKMAAENYLASEMDGAIEPIYPNSLNRLP